MTVKNSQSNLVSFFNQKEEAVIDFVTKHNGATKQTVVDALDGKYSRMIVFDTIKELEKYEIITIKKNKPNSQVHNLYINETNRLLIENDNLLEFEIAITDLFNKINEEDAKNNIQWDSEKKELRAQFEKTGKNHSLQKWNIYQIKHYSPDLSRRYYEYQNMYLKLFQVFWQVFQAYTIQMAFIWPNQINNEDIVYRLIYSVLEKLTLIQVKIAKLVYNAKAPGYLGRPMYNVTIPKFIEDSNILRHPFEDDINHFINRGLGKEVEKLSDSVKSITGNLLHETRQIGLRKLK
jgi:hypothetical protein